MEYQISLEQFQNSKMFDSKGKLYHKSGNRFKLFPFVTQPNSLPVTELEPLIGSFLCRVEEKTPKEITAAELVKKLKEDTEIQAGQEELFFETIRQLFFTIEGSLRPMNLRMIEHMTCTETSENLKTILLDILSQSGLNYAINGAQEYCISTTLNLSIKGVSSEALMLSSKQFCGISNGSACNSNSYAPSYVLLAMGLPLDQIESAVRISWGANTDEEELRRQFSNMLEVAKGLA